MHIGCNVGRNAATLAQVPPGSETRLDDLAGGSATRIVAVNGDSNRLSIAKYFTFTPISRVSSRYHEFARLALPSLPPCKDLAPCFQFLITKCGIFKIARVRLSQRFRSRKICPIARVFESSHRVSDFHFRI